MPTLKFRRIRTSLTHHKSSCWVSRQFSKAPYILAGCYPITCIHGKFRKKTKNMSRRVPTLAPMHSVCRVYNLATVPSAGRCGRTVYYTRLFVKILKSTHFPCFLFPHLNQFVFTLTKYNSLNTSTCFLRQRFHPRVGVFIRWKKNQCKCSVNCLWLLFVCGRDCLTALCDRGDYS